ncbi:hypothetical protein E2C01_034276 [Portunus trituberculatus]|uniref:Uncharacterized protein n=1 Tax=Portunus trituberculatus TaxID=210409 RepID=A0A5B7F2F3_PORTR|nr:hypothetical protein [Portunus trituberculatus]
MRLQAWCCWEQLGHFDTMASPFISFSLQSFVSWFAEQKPHLAFLSHFHTLCPHCWQFPQKTGFLIYLSTFRGRIPGRCSCVGGSTSHITVTGFLGTFVSRWKFLSAFVTEGRFSMNLHDRILVWVSYFREEFQCVFVFHDCDDRLGGQTRHHRQVAMPVRDLLQPHHPFRRGNTLQEVQAVYVLGLLA